MSYGDPTNSNHSKQPLAESRDVTSAVQSQLKQGSLFLSLQCSHHKLFFL